MELKYNGVTLPSHIVDYLVKASQKLNVVPSYLITKLHFEGVWGASTVARENNNWGGISTPEFKGNQTRPSGIVVTLGGKRPAHEGGYYYKYDTLDDFFSDWTYLIRRGGIYKVADSNTFTTAVKGMFVFGGASADYAIMDVPNSPTASQKRYELYLKGMLARRSMINSANNRALDVLDDIKGDDTMSVTAEQVLKVFQSYVGMDKYSSKHTQMVADYNSKSPKPVGYTLKTSDDYCDAGLTVVFDKAGASHLVGRECGVERHKNIFKQMNIWLGLVKPKPGDVVIWRWDGNRNGFANHIGIVWKVSGNTITTLEFNTIKNGKSTVAPNTYAWNASTIQGYARPKYSVVTNGSTPVVNNPEEKKVSEHIVVTIDSLRAFGQPSSKGEVVETIKRDLVKNIDLTVEAEGYLWGGWVSSADGKRRWTTLKTTDGKRKFVDIKAGTIGHGGKTYTEYLDTLKAVTPKPEQPVGGEEPKLNDWEFTINGVVYEIRKK